MADLAAAVLGDIGAQGLLAAAGLGEDVDDAHLVHLLGRIEPVGEHHLLGLGEAELARKQAMGAHAREQAEGDLGKAEAGAALGDDDVKSNARTAAERVAWTKAGWCAGQVETSILLWRIETQERP